jgi:steroid 5-alpha reductase family enzyme
MCGALCRFRCSPADVLRCLACVRRWGVFLTCAPGFTSSWNYVSVVSPIAVFCLLRFVSGVPILEKQADERWGNEPEYQVRATCCVKRRALS